MTNPDRKLYPAVPEDVANNFFQERFVQAAIQSYALKLLVYDPTKEEIIRWQH